MKKEGFGFVLVILSLVLVMFSFSGDGVSGYCVMADCTQSTTCPQSNSCPTPGGKSSQSFRTYSYFQVSGNCVEEPGLVTCDLTMQCQTPTCLDISFITDEFGDCQSSDPCPSVPVVCAYNARGKGAGWGWFAGGLSHGETFDSTYITFCSDGYDNDCDGECDTGNCPNGFGGFLPPDSGCCEDGDGDGYNVTGGGCGIVDCNDGDNTIYPGALELCDGKDNDCNSGTPDWADDTAPQNNNQFGVCSGSLKTCNGTSGWENNYTVEHIPLYASEIGNCNDGIDNDCNDLCDTVNGACWVGSLLDPPCTGTCDPSPELNCGDGIDNDCNGELDWDTQKWAGGFPMGYNGTHGDEGCPVGLSDPLAKGTSITLVTPFPYYANEYLTGACFSDIINVNSVYVYIDDVSGKDYCKMLLKGEVFGNGYYAFNCSLGTEGTKDVVCTVNQSSSYNSTDEDRLPITVEASPFQPPTGITECSDYEKTANNITDCNANLANVGLGPLTGWVEDPTGSGCRRMDNGTGCQWDLTDSVCAQKTTRIFHPNNAALGCINNPLSCSYNQNRGDCSNDAETFTLDYIPLGSPPPIGCGIPSRTLPCPGRIELPFFGGFQFIISFFAIAAIYGILILVKRR